MKLEIQLETLKARAVKGDDNDEVGVSDDVATDDDASVKGDDNDEVVSLTMMPPTMMPPSKVMTTTK